MSASKPEVPREPVGRYQFTLRGLMLLTTVCCVLLSLMVWNPIALLWSIALGTGLYGIVHGLRARRPWGVLFSLLITLAMVALLLSPGIGAGSGSRTYVVTVVVVDAGTGQPIADADVYIAYHLYDDSHREFQPARTGANGVINVSSEFRISTYFKDYDLLGRFEKRGWIHLSRHMLEVDAEGYIAVRAPLAEYIGTTSWDYYGPPLPEVTVKMRRRPGKGQGPQATKDRRAAAATEKSGRDFCAVQITLEVVDKATRSAVEEAAARVVPPDALSSKLGVRTARTGSGGYATLVVELPIVAGSDLSQRRGSVNVLGYSLEVDAPDYKPLRAPLWGFLGKEWDLFHSDLPRVTIELRREPAE